MDEKVYLECQCNTASHLMKIGVDEDGLYATFLLDNCMSFFERVKIAAMYIFKMGDCEDHFDSWMMKKEDAKELIKMAKIAESLDTL